MPEVSQHQQLLRSFTMFGRIEAIRDMDRQSKIVREIDEMEKVNFRRANYMRSFYSRRG